MVLIDEEITESNARKFGTSSIARAHFSKQYTKQWYTEARAHRFNGIIPARCQCCDGGDGETILHILRFPSRRDVHIEYNKACIRIMRDIEAPNHLLNLFEAGIEVALQEGNTHSGEEWNGNPNRSTIDRTTSELLLDKTIPNQYNMVFQQQTKLGWEHLFMGKMASGWKQCWPDKKHWHSSIAHTFMEWGRACWIQRNSILYGKRKEQYKITRLRLKAEAQVPMDAPIVETLILIQQD